MASDWYISSAAWSAIAQFAASTSYTVGQIVRPLTAPSTNAQFAFRCTTAGTSATEPSWPAGNNQTVTTGGATFTNVSGQPAYGWNAAAGNLYSFVNTSWNRPVPGDRVFLSSDHSETGVTASYFFNNATSAFGVIQLISVNRAGSVPPTASDVLPGAAISIATGSSSADLDAYCDLYYEGIKFTYGATSGGGFQFNSNSNKAHYLKNCSINMGSSSGARVTCANASKVTLDNTPITFGATGQSIGSTGSYAFDVTWINTAGTVQGTSPASLFLSGGSGGYPNITCRGLDLSAVTGILLTATGSQGHKVLLDSCRVAAGMTRYSISGTSSQVNDEVELINCYDGTSIINERHTAAGDVTTDRSTYLTSGAQDDIGNYSLKLISSSRNDFAAMPLDCFALDVENTVIGASKTATVEIVSSATLNNNDIRLLLEYMGTSGNPIASFGDSLPSVLTTASALPSSSNTWTNAPITPQKQLLQVTFTPQRAGRVRGLVRLGKPSTTCWVDPRITIT